jgi:ribosomal protein S18 acetylase RimI-like enzyme
MRKSKHFIRRSQQRGIGPELLALAETFGQLEGDRIILRARAANDLIAELDLYRKRLVRVADKGGIIFIQKGDLYITTFTAGRRG